MADDDDVIFQGQELQKYLNEIGYKDFEIASLHASLPTSPEAESVLSLTWSSVVNSFYCFSTSWFKSPWVADIKPEDHIILSKHIQLILECGLLFEDDVHFLNNVLSGPGTEYQFEKRRTWINALKLVSTINWLSGYLWNEAIWPVTGSVMFCVLWSWKKSRQNAQYYIKQQHLLKVMKDLYTIFWKSLKFLQENELILRGFTIAKTGSTVSRLENSELSCMIRKWDSSPGFCIALAKALVEATYILSGATQQIISLCPLFGQLDNSSHYLSYLDETSLGLLLSNEESNVKLGHVKRLHHVFLLLQSEFLRRLSLCFCPELWKCKSLKQVKNVMQTVFNVTKTLGHLHADLTKQYKVFYSYGTCERIQDSNLSLPIQKSDIFKTNEAQDALRSASLHLQILLLNTRGLEEKLEVQKSYEDTSFNEVLIHLSNTIQELDICRSCCEEGIVQIKRLTTLEAATTAPEKDKKTFDEHIITDTEMKIVHVGYTDLDPQVEDEIFEAEITTDVPSETVIISSQDEQMQYEKAKQLSKKMMQELKSVLVDKAQKWKEREAKVLQAKQCISESVSSATVPVTDFTMSINPSTAANNTSVFAPDERNGQCRIENETQNSSTSKKDDHLVHCNKVSTVSQIKLKTRSLHGSPHRKESPQHQLFHRSHTGSDSSLERCTDSTVSSSGSQHVSGRSPKHIYASETFRPLQNDLKFSVGLHLSSDALAKFQSRNTSGSDTFLGIGEKSSSEESVVEDQ